MLELTTELEKELGYLLDAKPLTGELAYLPPPLPPSFPPPIPEGATYSIPNITPPSNEGYRAYSHVLGKKGKPLDLKNLHDRHEIAVAIYAARGPQQLPAMSNKNYLAVLKTVSDLADSKSSFLDSLKGIEGNISVHANTQKLPLFKSSFINLSGSLTAKFKKDFQQDFGITSDWLKILGKDFWTQENIEELVTYKNIYTDAKELIKHKAKNVNIKLLENAIQNKDKLTVKQLNECKEMASSLNISFDNFAGQWQEVYPVLKKMKADMEREELKERLTSVHRCFNELGQIGYLSNNKHLVKAAHIGQSINAGIGYLETITKAQGIQNFITNSPLMKGLSTLHPYVGIAAIGFTLFSMLGSKKNKGDQVQVQAILQQLALIQMEMRQNFQEVFRRLDRIEINLFDIKSLLINGITSIKEEIKRLRVIHKKESEAVFLNDFERLLYFINKQLSLPPSKNLKEKCIKYLDGLEEWLLIGSCNDMLNGATNLEGHKSHDHVEYLLDVLRSENLPSLLGYLGGYANSLLEENQKSLPDDIYPGEFFNIAVWTQALIAYNRLYKFMKLKGFVDVDVENSFSYVMAQVNEQSNNLFRFSRYLRTSPDIYQILFDKYQQAITEINKLINFRFEKFRREINNNIQDQNSFSQSVDKFFTRGSEERGYFDKLLQEVDACVVLLNAYAGLAGLSNHLTERLLTSRKILKTQINPYYVASTVSKWNCNQGYGAPEFYKTLRTKVVTVDGKQKLYAVMRNTVTLEIYGYDHKSNTWVALAENIQPTWSSSYLQDGRFISTFAVETIKINNQEQLVAMMWTPSGLELHAYDPNQAAWQPLPKGPEWKPEYFNYFCLPNDARKSQGSQDNAEYISSFRTIVITVKDQQYLLIMLRSSLGLELHAYDPQKGQWTSLKPIEGFTNPIYNQEIAYSTLRALVVNVSSDHQKLIVIVHNGVGLDVYHGIFDVKGNKLTAECGHVLHKVGRQNNPVYWYAGQRPSYYKTFNTHVITLTNSEQRIIMMMRDSGNFIPYALNPNNYHFEEYGYFTPMPNNPYDRQEYYESLRAIPDGDKILAIFPRQSGHGVLETHIHDYENYKTKSWTTLHPYNGPLLLSDNAGSNMGYVSYKSLQFNLLEVDGEKQLVGFTLGKTQAHAIGYVLTPKQLPLGNEIKQAFISDLENRPKDQSPSKIEQHVRGFIDLMELLKVNSPQPENIKGQEYTGIKPNSCTGKSSIERRMNTLFKQIRPEEYQFSTLNMNDQQIISETYTP